MRHSLRFGVFVFALARASSAQHCHETTSEEEGVRAAVRSEFATFETSRFEGEYQGVALQAAWVHRDFSLRTALPGYRITRNGPESVGWGDWLIGVQVPFATNRAGTLVGSATITATLPTGDAARSLGMGHVMLMQGFTGLWKSSHAFVLGQVTYGRALTTSGGGHASHALGGPLVNPMNRSEVELSVSSGYMLANELRVRTGVQGAVPIGDADGASRATGFLGLDVLLGENYEIIGEGHLPLAGDPFTAKLVLSVARRF